MQLSKYSILLPAKRVAAFTLIELLTVIAIIGILAAILIPVVGAVRESARSSVCRSNLRQTGIAIHMYAQDHNDATPFHATTSTTTVYANNQLAGHLIGRPAGWGSDYTDTTEIFFCPSQPNVRPADGMNRNWSSRWGNPAIGYIWIYRASDLNYLNTSRISEDNQNNVIVMDQGYQAWLNAYNWVQIPHGDSLNVLRIGGHVTSVPLSVVNGTQYGSGTSAIGRRMNEYYGQ